MPSTIWAARSPSLVKGSVPGSWLGGGAIATSLRCGSAAALAAGKVESPPVIAVFLMSSNISRRVISPPIPKEQRQSSIRRSSNPRIRQFPTRSFLEDLLRPLVVRNVVPDPLEVHIARWRGPLFSRSAVVKKRNSRRPSTAGTRYLSLLLDNRP